MFTRVSLWLIFIYFIFAACMTHNSYVKMTRSGYVYMFFEDDVYIRTYVMCNAKVLFFQGELASLFTATFGSVYITSKSLQLTRSIAVLTSHHR